MTAVRSPRPAREPWLAAWETLVDDPTLRAEVEADEAAWDDRYGAPWFGNRPDWVRPFNNA